MLQPRRLIRSLALVAVLAPASCSGSSKQPEPPVNPAGAGGSGQTGGTDGTTAEAPLTEAECTSFLEHLLALQLAEMRANRPADEIPTEAQLAEIKTKMIAEEMDKCQAQSRAVLECALAAKSIADIPACEKTTSR